MNNSPIWRRYQELRPDQLAELVRTAPIAYWPLGLLEHHGWPGARLARKRSLPQEAQGCLS